MALLRATTSEPERRWPLMTALRPGLHFIGASLAGKHGGSSLRPDSLVRKMKQSGG